MFERYAVFYTPPAGAFAAFGAAWLGWDSAKVGPVAHPEGTGLDLPKLTARPRKYGFHATLKAPFYPTKGTTEETLRAAVAACAGRHGPVDLQALQLETKGGFLSLRPTTEPTPLRQLARAVVQELDPLRAPLTPEDIARRRKSRLTARQDQQMLDWGYPYVFDDFNFHMTLSGPLKGVPDNEVITRAQIALGPVLPKAPLVDALTLMGQDQEGRFHQLLRVHLTV